jgi:transcriptional regulator GlxA family with amidase domain
MRSKHIIDIGIVNFPSSQLSAAQGLGDLFTAANRLADRRQADPALGLRVTHWRLDEAKERVVRSPSSTKGSGANPVVLVLPPSVWEPPAPEDAEPFVDWLRQHHKAGTTLCSVCGGAFVLAATGLMTGRTMTTHWHHAEKFRERFPDVALDIDRLLIEDGDVISAGGMMAWVDLGLRLVDRFMGPTIMAETARYLLVDPPGREQRFYSAFSPNLIHGDPAVLKVQHWLQATGAKDTALAEMAERAGLEERTLLRRFRKATGLTPIDYCQRVRIGKAREMLQFRTASIEAIAWEVGYTDPGAFRKIFLRVTGLTPADYRRRFSVIAEARVQAADAV